MFYFTYVLLFIIAHSIEKELHGFILFNPNRPKKNQRAVGYDEFVQIENYVRVTQNVVHVGNENIRRFLNDKSQTTCTVRIVNSSGCILGNDSADNEGV